MAGLSLGPRLSTTNLLFRGTRRQSRTCILDSVSRSRAAVGDPQELLEVLHSIERVVMVAAPLLMMMRLRITELSIGRGRAPAESQIMMTVLMMSSRLRRRRHL
jgi:hypothetical protein